jgi:2-polyprenyl-6-methoxyphenol hydroxylase-like FAD-dependent oxidoreductase
MQQSFLTFFLILFTLPIFSQDYIETDVLVVGGGASGVTASIQTARLNVKTVLVEETTWLGGMLTGAGVSATDGNHNMPSGMCLETNCASIMVVKKWCKRVGYRTRFLSQVWVMRFLKIWFWMKKT